MITNKRVTTGIRMNLELNKRISKAAEYMGVTKNALILQILWRWAEEKEKEEESRC